MNIIKGLYFPGTIVGGRSFDGLFCLLDTMDYYRAVGDNGEQVDLPEKTPSWQGQDVAPLGKDRERFLAMIRDIRLYGAEFYENCLARMSAEGELDRDESSAWQLAANLQEGSEARQEKARFARLWQARVVLKLAEILTEEQAAIDQGLEQVKQGEQRVFSGLKGEEGDDEVEDIFPSVNGEVSAARPVNAGQVLPAWGVFHAIDCNDHPLLVTDNREAAAIIFDVLEQISGKAGRFLADFSLPEVPSPAILEKKRDELAESRQAVAGALGKIIAGEDVAGFAELENAAAAWKKNVDKEKQPGGCLFSLYLIPDGSLGKVWERVSGLSGGKIWPTRTLVGVLGEPV